MAPQPIIRWTQFIWPLLLGAVAAGAVVWLGAHHEVPHPETGAPSTSWEVLKLFEWSWRSSWALAGVFACVLLRDFGYIARLRTLSFGAFTWRQSTENIMLWELASALTPSVVGGSAVAVLILRRDGMRWGKSLATVFATALLDEAFYLIAVPLVFGVSWLTGHLIFPEIPLEIAAAEWGLPTLFWMAYAFIGLLTITMLYGLVLQPAATHRFLRRVSRGRAMNRWASRINQWADDLLEASITIRNAPSGYWTRGFTATCISWTARFLTLNMVLLIFYPQVEHAAVLARQLILWLMLSVSPTPGSSGAAELGVPAFVGDLTGLTYIAAVVILWRLVTYFIYLVIGALVLPEWLVRTQKAHKAN